MNAIQMHKTGGPEVLELVDLPIPVPGPGQVLIKIAATGVNFIETYVREGRYKAPLPLVPGTEAAGVIEAVGEGVDSFRAGDRVASTSVQGSYAEYALVPASALVKVPDDVDLKLAAAAILQGMTAHYLVHSTYPLKKGETALIHAAAGGTGCLLVQMAHHAGARIIATVSSDEKAEIARSAGADEVIKYTEVDFEAETKRLTDEHGVDVVYDSVGKTTFEKSLNCLRPRGMMVLFGGSSGAVPPYDLIQLSTHGSLYVTRPTLKDYIATPEDLRHRAGDVFRWIEEGKLHVRMPHLYPLADAAQAQIDLVGRKTTGKLLIIP
ncbi:quinone oxidoreductase family protein [Acidicapsa dinghuensis]|uniref:Quinone oxidoreductase family protein n=1 Tax=Acidicapsa dinghuensis TaxID=2218256 RepID=A0ABW1EGW6_9BACT|nr:quinone oxidoreductase [Acidicapsa dinghuensis]